MRIIWKISLVFLLAFIALGVVFVVRTVNVPRPKIVPCDRKDADYIANDDVKRPLFKRLGEAIKFKTVSRAVGEISGDELLKFRQYLMQTYPLVFKAGKTRIVANYSILLTFDGSDKSLKPYMLCAHLDVVPVQGQNWSRDPFAGDVMNDVIWGRGAVDDKMNVMAMLESLQFLLERKYVFRRSFYIALGHDEEIHGLEGAANIAKLLEKELGKGEDSLEFILDEGMFILSGSMPGIAAPIAYVAVCEKGATDIRLTVKQPPGHSSMPPRETAIGILSRAITRFTSTAYSSSISPVMRHMMHYAAPFSKFPFNLIYANLWFFEPFVKLGTSLRPSGDAMIRTTTAVTIVRGGIKTNVVPSEAYAVINHRILPGTSVQQVLEYDRKLVRDIPEVNVEIEGNPIESSAISPHDPVKDFGFGTIARTVLQVYPDTYVGPSLMVANTDTRHYWGLSRAIYRFTGLNIHIGDTSRFHGVDERLETDRYEKLVNYYYHLMRNADEKSLKPIFSKRNLEDEL